MGQQTETTGGTAELARGNVGDWLVVPGWLNEHQWRWGRITAVVPGEGTIHYQLRWIGADQDSVVLPPPGSRIESSEVWPSPAGDAIGVWPH